VHEVGVRTRQEAVVDEEILLDAEPGVAALQLAGAVVAHAVAQREVLRTRRRADRVGLHEAQAGDGARQRGGREQRARDRVTTQLLQGGCGWHAGIMPRDFARCFRMIRP
jgi:hypothetical protein